MTREKQSLMEYESLLKAVVMLRRKRKINLLLTATHSIQNPLYRAMRVEEPMNVHCRDPMRDDENERFVILSRGK